uniref:Uncharacterized protein n=1 Tax=viral metagenome TaxID=1070528 RepID=A0A6H1Z9M2_9ZZZZ
MTCKRCTDLEAELEARREAGRQMTRFAQDDTRRVVELENKLREVERERDEARMQRDGYHDQLNRLPRWQMERDEARQEVATLRQQIAEDPVRRVLAIGTTSNSGN